MKLPLKLNNENDIYYNCKKPYSYNPYFLGIDGARGLGKTTTFLIDALKQCEKGKQFVYLRRYKPELKEFVTKDSLGPIIDGIKYKGDGNGGYTFLWKDNILGYGIPLIKQRDYKSVDFSKVTRIIFDEAFVLETIAYRYLQKEVTLFWEMISTITRTRKDYKIILIANNEDLFNPYYRFFNIPIFNKVYVDTKRGLYFEHGEPSEKLIELEKQTPLFNMIKDTDYGSYHYGNKNINLNTKIDIINKPSNCKLLFRLEINGKTLNCYSFATIKGKLCMYIEFRDKIIDDTITYHLVKDEMPNYYYVDLYKKKIKHYINRMYYNDNSLYCDNETSATLIKWVITSIK